MTPEHSEQATLRSTQSNTEFQFNPEWCGDNRTQHNMHRNMHACIHILMHAHVSPPTPQPPPPHPPPPHTHTHRHWGKWKEVRVVLVRVDKTWSSEPFGVWWQKCRCDKHADWTHPSDKMCRGNLQQHTTQHAKFGVCPVAKLFFQLWDGEGRRHLCTFRLPSQYHYQNETAFGWAVWPCPLWLLFVCGKDSCYNLYCL